MKIGTFARENSTELYLKKKKKKLNGEVTLTQKPCITEKRLCTPTTPSWITVLSSHRDLQNSMKL